MEIKSTPVLFDINELSLNQLRGLMKLVGQSSISSRMEDFNLTKDESESLYQWFYTVDNHFQENGISRD